MGRRAVTRLVLSGIVALGAATAGHATWHGWRLWRGRTIAGRIDRYADLIGRYSRENDLPAELVRSVIRAESGGDPKAVSRTGARGLMQLMPDAEKDVLRRLRIPKGDLFDPEYNIRVGAAYLRQMVNRFDGDVYLALAAYNMGPTRLAGLRREHPGLTGRELVRRHAPRVTHRYCQDIIRDRWDRLAVARPRQ